jgi:anti-sigma factor RsiW
MVDCERFTEILAAGDEAPAAEREAARGHAAACPECRAVAAALEGVEASLAELTPAPAGFAERVMARLPLGREGRPLALPGRVDLLPTWVFSGVAAVVAAALAAVVAYFAYTDPEGLAAAANAFNNMPAVDVTAYGSIVGASAAAAAVAGFLAYYYLVPAE